jgi:DNA helicase-2/ATP-dependent DNA helicase PcrA
MVLKHDLESVRMRWPRRRREPVPLDQLPVWTDRHVGPDQVTPVAEVSGLDALLGGLNVEQRRAVTHGEGPLLVVAGAGTGKTQVITRRIAWLIATHRAKPSEILALTFTDKAADEMQLRVDQLVPYGYTDSTIATFHAFGDRLIREFAFELGLPSDVRVLSRPETVIFLREHLFDFELDQYRPLGDPTRFLGALSSLFSRCKDEDIDPAAYQAHASRLEEAARASQAIVAEQGPAATEADRTAADVQLELARRQMELAGAYTRYQQLLHASGFIDFGDQVNLALRLLRQSAAARQEIQDRYRFILVDEFQDTNRAQAELVSLLAEPHRNITVVGDDDQSIYTFRGAAVSNILEFADRHPRVRSVVLRRNYRSRAPILAASHRLIRFNDPDRLEVKAGISKQLRPERRLPLAAPVRLEAFASGTEEADWVAAEIGRRIADGARPRDHAVLVRTNAAADAVLRSLNIAGIPWRFTGTSGLYSRPEVRILLSVLRAVADLSSSVDVYALAASEVYGLGGEDLTAIVNAARRRNRTLWEIVEELERQPGLIRVSAGTRTGVARLVADLRALTRLAHERPAGEVLYRFLRDSGWLERLATAESQRGAEALQNVARLFDILRSQSSLLADDRAVFVARHIQTLIEAGDDPPSAELDPEADVVSVLTVHKAKGLEFPIVFMPGLVAGRFPAVGRRDPLDVPPELLPNRETQGDPALQEERRLFYVGMTRARDELILSHAADYGGSRARRISPFVLEALDLPSTAGTPGVGAHQVEPLERIGSFEPRQPAAEVPLGPITEPLTLSFGQIDDYLTCPRKYRDQHVLRVPVAPHHAMIYGAALHKAVQEFHRRHARGDVMTEAELIDAFEVAWRNEGFLTREHEEARLEAGRAALRRFRTEQLQPGAVVPAYVEREFGFLLNGDRINGRWDRVDIEPVLEGSVAPPPAAASSRAAAPVAVLAPDVIADTLPLMPRERVTITDYKSSDVRDPAQARQRARDSLQLTIYAMGYQAMTGRLPDAVQLHFLESGLVGRAEVDDRRIARGQAQIADAAAGIRARNFAAKPDTLSCTYCAFRDICPASAAR